ncbi:unnamed protein product [Eruca vesicaria subsp. sativa]|uniref:Uncharacterized protein n=1 Tax=Eruca vesicaria subsp. sativa TaxID=29727 RepID=A0ABC8JTT0_ERUVS|nr:unnamed protein product [Eruca vesicaria subsp. sativa]
MDGKMKSVASIPANYVSILQLQERWMKEKEGKHKERDLGVKQQEVNEQRRREEADVSAVVSKKKEDEDGEYSRKKKKKWSKKKKQGGSVKEVVKSGTKAYIPREINPLKEEIPGDKTVQNIEKAAASNSISVETQFQHLWIKKKVEEDGRDREVKEPAKLNRGQGYYRNQKHETSAMMWVKKG